MIAERFKENHDCDESSDESDNTLHALCESMKDLYQKYIEQDCAPLEINISSRKRMQIQSLLGRKVCNSSIPNVECVFKVMEAAVEEIVALLTGAAMRFRTQNINQKHLPLRSYSRGM